MTRGLVSGCAVVAALGAVAFAGSASGDLLAGWSFNGLSTPVASSIAADHGAGTLDLSAFTAGLSWQAGTDLNAWSGDPAGEGLGVTGTGANGKSAVFTVSSAGYKGLALSMAVRTTGTGHVSSVVEAWNGAGWVLVSGFTLTPSTWSTSSFDLSSKSFLDDGAATLRIRFEGATSSQGNFRLDNVKFEGTAVPAPAALALMGTALSVGRRRRK